MTLSKIVALAGLGLKGGNLVVGVDAVREAIMKERIRLVLIAADASARARERIVTPARLRSIPLVEVNSALEFGARLGKSVVMVAGVKDAGLAREILEVAAK